MWELRFSNNLHTEVPSLEHFWSLAVEEQFYLCWPLAIFWLDRKWLPRLLGLVIVSAPIMRFLILSSSGDLELLKRLASSLTPARADGLAFGALVAIVLRQPALCAKLLQYSSQAIAGATGLLFLWFGLKSRFQLESAVSVALLYTLLGVGFSFIVLRTMSRSGGNEWTLRLLRLLVLRQAGRYSYAAYVFHLPVLDITEQVFLKLSPEARQLWAFPWFMGTFALTFLLAWLSWRLIEQPLLRMKNIWAPAPGELQKRPPYLVGSAAWR